MEKLFKTASHVKIAPDCSITYCLTTLFICWKFGYNVVKKHQDALLQHTTKTFPKTRQLYCHACHIREHSTSLRPDALRLDRCDVIHTIELLRSVGTTDAPPHPQFPILNGKHPRDIVEGERGSNPSECYYNRHFVGFIVKGEENPPTPTPPNHYIPPYEEL